MISMQIAPFLAAILLFLKESMIKTMEIDSSLYEKLVLKLLKTINFEKKLK